MTSEERKKSEKRKKLNEVIMVTEITTTISPGKTTSVSFYSTFFDVCFLFVSSLVSVFLPKNPGPGDHSQRPDPPGAAGEIMVRLGKTMTAWDKNDTEVLNDIYIYMRLCQNSLLACLSWKSRASFWVGAPSFYVVWIHGPDLSTYL